MIYDVWCQMLSQSHSTWHRKCCFIPSFTKSLTKRTQPDTNVSNISYTFLSFGYFSLFILATKWGCCPRTDLQSKTNKRHKKRSPPDASVLKDLNYANEILMLSNASIHRKISRNEAASKIGL